MNKCINGRKYLSSRSFSAYNFTLKNFNNLITTSLESTNCNQLPVIMEEGIISEEDKSESLENSLSDTLKKKCLKKKTLRMGDSKGNKNSSKKTVKERKTFTKLPLVVNINCLMNTDIKQSHHIWDTNFGKRLMNGKNDNLCQLDSNCSTGVKRGNYTKARHTEKHASQPSKFTSTSRTIADLNVKNGGGDRANNLTQKKLSRKKPKKRSKINQHSSKKFCQGRESLNDNIGVSEAKSSMKIMQSPSEENLDKMLSKEMPKESLSNQDTLEIIPTVSTPPKNRRLLTESVRNILDCNLSQLECEHCKEHFPNIEELCQHKKHHESKKEICLLCEKVFYNPNEFVQHLLSHEGVDQFSCKKCKKYFPNVKKYKQHCQDFHIVLENTSNYQSETSFEYVRRWLTKYECKRCKMEFDFDKVQEHKRNHIKSDLAGAYLLSPKNI